MASPPRKRHRRTSVPDEGPSQPEHRGVTIQQWGSGSFHVDGNAFGHASTSHEPLKLDDAPSAAFDSKTNERLPFCLEDTRRDVLDRIERWADSDAERHVFWLKGMAGTGKTTIARTVAQKYEQSRRLAASFFFSRNTGGDLVSVSKFAATIAVQIAESVPSSRPMIQDAANNLRLPELGAIGQWAKLILDPLKTLRPDAISSPMIVVVDALDECHEDDDIRLIVKCLIDLATMQEARIRVFVTSRPDPPVNFGFRMVPEEAYRHFILHDVELAVVDADLERFFRWRLTQNQYRYGQSGRFLSEDVIRSLVARSHGLFIYASTICRYMQRLSNKGLDQLLNSESGMLGPEKALDELYLAVLTESMDGPIEIEVADQDHFPAPQLSDLFQPVVGSVAVMFEMMSASNLSILLSLDEDDVSQALHSLHSVLDVPEDCSKPIRLLHPSFRDFLLNPQRCKDKSFFISAPPTLDRLGKACLVVLKQYLPRPSLSAMDEPTARPADVSKEDIESTLAAPVQYACRYGIQHLLDSNGDWDAREDILDFFQNRFLFWLEALAWTGHLHEGIMQIRELEARLRSRAESKMDIENMVHDHPAERASNYLLELVYDAMRFALTHSSTIEEFPQQTYSSALVFSPEQSHIRKLNMKHRPTWIEECPIFPGQWPAQLHTLSKWGDESTFCFSTDSQLIATNKPADASFIRLWNAKTGTVQQDLHGHSRPVRALAFSACGQLLASGSNDGEVRLWDAKTGAALGTLHTYSKPINSLAFSSKEELIVVSTDSEVSLLPVTGDLPLWTWSHDRMVYSVALSPENHLIAVCQYGNEVSVLRATDGAQLWSSRVRHAKEPLFSGDGSLLACRPYAADLEDYRQPGSSDGSKLNEVRLLDSRTGAEHLVLRGHSPITTVAWSSGIGVLASGSENGTIQLWDARSGTELQVLEGHGWHVRQIAFSPDGHVLASAYNDNTIWLWDVETGALRQHIRISSEAYECTFSPDGKVLASALAGGLFLWDATATSRIGNPEDDDLEEVWPMTWEISAHLRLAYSHDFDYTSTTLWDWQTGCRLPAPPRCSEDLVSAATSLDGRVMAAVSEDTRDWPVASTYYRVDLWDTGTGAQGHLLHLGYSFGRVKHIQFSPDGLFLAVASNYDITIWDVETGVNRHVFAAGRTVHFAFSPEGLLVATVGNGEKASDYSLSTQYQFRALHVKLWDVQTGAEKRTVGQSICVCIFYEPFEIAFSEDGMSMVHLCTRKMRVWDVKTGEFHDSEMPSLDGQAPQPKVSFSPDGSLVLVDKRNVIEMYDSKTGSKSHSLATPSCDMVGALAFSSCGAYFATPRGMLPLPKRSITPSSPARPFTYATKSWISHNGKDLIKIHPDYDERIAFVSESFVRCTNPGDSVLRFNSRTTPFDGDIDRLLKKINEQS